MAEANAGMKNLCVHVHLECVKKIIHFDVLHTCHVCHVRMYILSTIR